MGGNAINVAVRLALLEEQCSYFGAIGRDEAGRWTRNALFDNKVGVGHLQELDAPTAYTDIDVDTAGERIIAFEEFGTSALFHLTQEDISALAAMDHVHIGWFKAVAALRQALAGSGVSFSQDVAVKPDAAGLEIGFESVGPSEVLARSALQRLHGTGCRVAVVTCGAMGSMASDASDVVSTGIRALPLVVDTTRAGDTFIAGFLSAWKRDQPLAACRAAAARHAAMSAAFPRTCGRCDPFSDQR